MSEYLCSDGRIRTLKELGNTEIGIIQKRVSFETHGKRLFSKYCGLRYPDKLTGSKEWILT